MARLRGCLRFAGVGLGLIVWPVCGSFNCPAGSIGAGCFAPVVGPGLSDRAGIDWGGSFDRLAPGRWPRLAPFAGLGGGLAPV